MNGHEKIISNLENSRRQLVESTDNRIGSERRIELLKAVAADITPLVGEIKMLFLNHELEKSKNTLAVAKNGSVPLSQRMVQSMRQQLQTASTTDPESIKEHLRVIDPAFVLEEAIAMMIVKLKGAIEKLILEYNPEQDFFDAYLTDDIRNSLAKL